MVRLKGRGGCGGALPLLYICVVVVGGGGEGVAQRKEGWAVGA